MWAQGREVWTLPRINAGDLHWIPFLRPHRLEVCELALAHGHDPYGISWVEYDVHDAPLLRFGLFVHDEVGRVRKDPERDAPMIKTCEHILKGALPQWWCPELAGAGTGCGSS